MDVTAIKSLQHFGLKLNKRKHTIPMSIVFSPIGIGFN